MITLPPPPAKPLQPLQPPLPSSLKYLARLDAPLHLCRAEVAALLEFWGFTKNGEEHLKKLVRCGALSPIKITHQSNCRFLTREVLAWWEQGKQ